MAEKITNIKERILQLTDYYGIAKEKFFDDLGISYGNFKGKSKNTSINSDVLAEIFTKYPEINPLWIVTGSGEMILPKETSSKNISLKTVENTSQKMPKVITIDEDGRENIVLVPVKAAAGYLNGYGDPEYIEKLPTYKLPNLNNGTYRMFQVNGHSMLPTLHHGAYVVGQFVENWLKDIKDDRVYILVTRNDGIIVKRCLNRIKKYGHLYCKSDNRREYPSYSIEPENIIEVWEYKMNLSFELPNPADLYDRVSDLEAEMSFLKSNIKKTELKT